MPASPRRRRGRRTPQKKNGPAPAPPPFFFGSPVLRPRRRGQGPHAPTPHWMGRRGLCCTGKSGPNEGPPRQKGDCEPASASAPRLTHFFSPPTSPHPSTSTPSLSLPPGRRRPEGRGRPPGRRQRRPSRPPRGGPLVRLLPPAGHAAAVRRERVLDRGGAPHRPRAAARGGRGGRLLHVLHLLHGLQRRGRGRRQGRAGRGRRRPAPRL